MEKQTSISRCDLHSMAKYATDERSPRQMIHRITATNFHEEDGLGWSVERFE